MLSAPQRQYGTRDKSESGILGMLKHFVVNIGLPPVVRSDRGAEYTNSTFVEYCNDLGIRRERMTHAPGKRSR